MKSIVTLIINIVFFSVTTAQVGVGTTTPDTNSILDVVSTSKGFKFPRLLTAERTGISLPAKGLTVFDTDLNCLMTNFGTPTIPDWKCLGVTPVTPAVVSSWTSGNGCRIGAGPNGSPDGVRRGGVNETMVQGTAAPATASVTLIANVTTAGSYSISTNTVNGITFSGSGVFSSLGANTVTLFPSGTPTAAGNFKWTTNLTPTIDVYGSVITTNAPSGSSYTTHYNGIVSGVSVNYLLSTYSSGETFNDNTTCATKPISAQGCGGVTSVTGSSGRVYPTVNINGQCWLQTNSIDIPSEYNGYTTTSWTNAITRNQGYWGYYNTTDLSGVSGWGAVEPAANEGRLYQWCGAMNATISERSRGICPSGFHVPSDCEWMYLEHGQGMSITEQNSTNARAITNTNRGGPGRKLRSQGTGSTNTSGFSGLLVGYRVIDGSFRERSLISLYFTSSAVTPTTAYYRGIGAGSHELGVSRMNNTDMGGSSVRCLKD